MNSASKMRLYKPPLNSKGFTFVELVVVLVLVGVISFFAVPKLLDNNAIELKSYADRIKATTMYANRLSLAQRKPIQVTYNSNNVTLQYVSGGAIAMPVVDPSTNLPYNLNCPVLNCITSTGNVIFNNLNTGRSLTSNTSTLNVVFSITGYTQQISIENETGNIR